MKCFRRSNFIPVVIFLSLLLAGFMYVAFHGTPAPQTSMTLQDVTPIDPEAYQKQMAAIMHEYDQDMAAAQKNQDRLLVVQKTLSDVLDVRVPAEYKEAHLTLVVGLNEMQQNIQDLPEDPLDDGVLQTIDSIKAENPWLAQ